MAMGSCRSAIVPYIVQRDKKYSFYVMILADMFSEKRESSMERWFTYTAALSKSMKAMITDLVLLVRFPTEIWVSKWIDVS